jgi:hypothetical protein
VQKEWFSWRQENQLKGKEMGMVRMGLSQTNTKIENRRRDLLGGIIDTTCLPIRLETRK